MLVVGVGAALVAVLLHLPWSLDVRSCPGTALIGVPGTRDRPAVRPRRPPALRGGPARQRAAGLVLPGRGRAAAPHRPGRASRLGRPRLDAVGASSSGLAWAAERGDLPFAMPPVDVLLVPAAVGPRAGHRHGRGRVRGRPARAIASGGGRSRRAAAAAAVVVGIIPVLGASIDGRWSMPAGDHARAARLHRRRERRGCRSGCCGWATLPPCPWTAGSSTEASPTRTTDDGRTRPGEPLGGRRRTDATGLLAEAVDLARDGETARLGRLLAPMGVRYVVVPERLAPAPFADDELPGARPVVATTLEAQLDLEPLDVPAGLTVYRNEAFMPTRAVVPADRRGPERGWARRRPRPRPLGRPPALPDEDGRLRWSGPLDADTTLCPRPRHPSAGTSRSTAREAERIEPFGWANGFSVTAGGDATLLSTPRPPLRRCSRSRSLALAGRDPGAASECASDRRPLDDGEDAA